MDRLPITARELLQRPGILVMAHRGDSLAAPENSLPAFELAVQAGADMVELDYQSSADGVPIVIHDKTLDRTTDAVARFGGDNIAVASKHVSDLVQLDAGGWFGAPFAGTKLATLEQAIETIQRGSMTLIERKNGDAATCVDLLRRMDVLEHVVVQAFDWDYLAECHRLAPALELCALGEDELTPAKFAAIEKTGAAAIGWNGAHTTDAMVADIHAHGYKAWVWAVDDPDRVRFFARSKIDGIITNRPAQTRKLIDALLAGQ